MNNKNIISKNLKVPSNIDFLFYYLDKSIHTHMLIFLNNSFDLNFFYNLSFGDENFRRNYSVV